MYKSAVVSPLETLHQTQLLISNSHYKLQSNFMAPSFPTQNGDGELEQAQDSKCLTASDVIEDVPDHSSSTEEEGPQNEASSRDHHNSLDMRDEVQPTTDAETTRTITHGEDDTAQSQSGRIAKQISAYMDEHNVKYGYILTGEESIRVRRANSGLVDAVDEIAGNDSDLAGITVI
jgi:hypothetical protein